MDAKKRKSDWKEAFKGKKVLPAEDVLEYISKAESDDDLRELAEIAATVDRCYLTGSTEKQNELKLKIVEIKRRFIESHPRELVIMRNRLFYSVCCDEMKDAVLKGDIESAIDVDSIACLFVRSPEIMAKMQNTDDLDYPDDYFLATGQCPFCGADLCDRPVNMDGVEPENLEWAYRF